MTQPRQKKDSSKTIIRIILILGVIQGIVLGGLVYYTIHRSNKTYDAVHQEHDNNCHFLKSLLPRGPNEVPTSPYEIRLLGSIKAQIKLDQC